MKRTALNAVINLVDSTSGPPSVAVEECVTLFNSIDTHRKMRKSKVIQNVPLQYVCLQEPNVALVDMGMIWRKAIPSAEGQRTQHGTPYKWSDYVHKVSPLPAIAMLTVSYV